MSPQLVLLLALLQFSTADSPASQLRLSYTGVSGQLKLTWVADGDLNMTVQYQSTNCKSMEDSFMNEANATFKSFDVGKKHVRIQYVYSALLQNLSPSCDYTYQVCTQSSCTDTFSFSGRTIDFEADQASIIAFGDWGFSDFGTHTLDFIQDYAKSVPMQAMLHLGDIAYDLHDSDGQNGDDFLEQIQPVTSRFPYMVIPGNHEDYRNFTQFINRFSMPSNSANQGTGMFYSFDLGPAHFTLINTEAFWATDEEATNMLNWVAQDLAQANTRRAARPWLIVAGHRPLYCSDDYTKSDPGKKCGSNSVKMQGLFEGLFHSNKVDLYIQGHVHLYERTTPIYQNKTVINHDSNPYLYDNPQAPFYIVTGTAGQPDPNREVSPTRSDWSVYSSSELGFGRLDVNRTHLSWEQYDSVNGEVYDHVVVVKDAVSYF